MSEEKTFQSAEEILDFAIQREQESHDWYMKLAEKATRPYMKKVFERFAMEEKGHKAKLEGVKQGRRILGSQKKILDLKMSDYLVADPEVPGEELDYQQALLLAMQKEKKAFLLYTHLAERVEDEGLRELFEALAQEEAKHKLRFELEYDEVVLTEN